MSALSTVPSNRVRSRRKFGEVSCTDYGVCRPAKICQGHLQTMYSGCSRFHPDRLTFGGVMSERVNTVRARSKVDPTFGCTYSFETSNGWLFRCTEVLETFGLVWSSTQHRARTQVHLISTGSTEARRLFADGAQTILTRTPRVVSAWKAMAIFSIVDVATKAALYARKLEVCTSYAHKYFQRLPLFSFVSFLGYYTIRQTAQNIYTPCPEKNGTSILSTLPNDNRFSIFFTGRLGSKFLENW